LALSGCALTWIPLLVFLLFSGHVAALKSFGMDFTNHARFLIALPLLLLAEEVINSRLNLAADYFVHSNVINQDGQKRLVQTIDTINRIEKRIWPDLILLAAVVAASFLFKSSELEGHALAWREAVPAADAWHGHVSVPIFRLVTFQWLLRLGLWSWLLFRMSRVKFNLLSYHPDGVGGLGFLRWPQRAFSLIALAFSSILAANAFETALAQSIEVQVLARQVFVFYLLSTGLFLGPLLFFTPVLVKMKMVKLLNFSQFSDYVAMAFQNQWVSQTDAQLDQKQPLSTNAISSMIDLISTQQHAEDMREVLWDRVSIIFFACVTILPFVPVFFTAYGWDRAVKLIVKFTLG
jgi:hypothetical protein